jgi:hypothetical protein
MYVDKTDYLRQLAAYGRYYFLSRLHRYGKSLPISTLQALFRGSKDLFRGFAILDRRDWSQSFPVIRRTLTGIGFVELGLETALHHLLDKVSRDFGIQPPDTGISGKFEHLIQQLAHNTKVVVLIDEYDAPIVHFLGTDTVRAIKHRGILREFYTVLKNNDSFQRFVFLTGVASSARPASSPASTTSPTCPCTPHTPPCSAIPKQRSNTSSPTISDSPHSTWDSTEQLSSTSCEPGTTDTVSRKMPKQFTTRCPSTNFSMPVSS